MADGCYEKVGKKWLFKQECSLADIVDIVILNDALCDHKGICEKKTFFFDNKLNYRAETYRTTSNQINPAQTCFFIG